MVIKSSPHIWPTKEIFNRLNRCWVACKKRLLEILGEFKDKTADRWISLTRDWDPEVSNHVSKWKTINQKYAIGNEYMIHTKAQTLSKLTPDNPNLLREEVRPSGFEKRDREEGAKTTETFPEWC